MKKIILTEKQSKKLMGKVVSEQLIDDGRYHQEVTCSYEYHGLKYKGFDIDWINDTTLDMSFRIDMDARSYGIKDIIVYDFKGYEALQANIEYYPEGRDADPVDEDIEIPVNWDNVDTEEADIGWIGIDQDITLQLTNDEQGNLIGGQFLIRTKGV